MLGDGWCQEQVVIDGVIDLGFGVVCQFGDVIGLDFVFIECVIEVVGYLFVIKIVGLQLQFMQGSGGWFFGDYVDQIVWCVLFEYY